MCTAERVLQRPWGLEDGSDRFFLQTQKRGTEREIDLPGVAQPWAGPRTPVFRPSALRARLRTTCTYLPAGRLRPSSGDTWMPSRNSPRWRRCKYFPLGLQVSKIPSLPRSFRQFTLPFSKQIFILIKAFITIIHLSLHSIRQLQSTARLSHRETCPSTLAGGRGAHKQNVSLKNRDESLIFFFFLSAAKTATYAF